MRIPLLGFEVRVFRTSQPLSSAEIENNNRYSIKKKVNDEEIYQTDQINFKDEISSDRQNSVISDNTKFEETDSAGRWVAVVNKIYPTSPAERAGLRVGGEFNM